MPNGPEFIESLFGILFTGAVAVPVNARFTARGLGHVARDADLRMLLASDAPGEPRTRVDVIAEALGPDLASTGLASTDLASTGLASTGLAAVVALGLALRPDQGSGEMMSREAFIQLAEQVPADVVEASRRRVALRDPAIMFYTSGTTAMPKGCVLSHEAQARTGGTTRIRLGYADGERVFAPCPSFHTASTQPMAATMHAFVAQVVGVADEKHGEVPAAFIELHPGTTLTEQQVIAHCRGGLASFKVPRYVRFVTEWPMTSTKVQTFRLREQLEAELALRSGPG
jgi:acyl-CoA synthetase (AMP-forming)/AMP-acid ligase II